jgi:glycine hydroxymethyltransferase
MANAIALAAVTHPGDQILVQSLQGGGNLSYHPGAVPDLLGLSVASLPPAPHFDLDLDAARRVALATRPAAIVVGGSYMLFPLPVKELRVIADETGAALIYDAAHVGLLIAAGLLPDPLTDGADIMTLGTHKIMGGPIGGLVLTNREDLAERVVNRTYPLFLQTRDQNKYAAAAHSMAELVAFGSEYARQMVANARTLAAALEGEGFTVVGAGRGYTMTHQVLIDARPLGGASAEARCQAANILVHKARMVDDEPDSPTRSGIRITTQEITRQGMKEAEMTRVARLMADATWNRKPTALLLAEVAGLAGSYPAVHYSFDQGRLGLATRAP